MTYVAPARPTLSASGSGRLRRALGRCRLALVNWNERRITRAVLARLSDQQLHDVGLSRTDIAGGLRR